MRDWNWISFVSGVGSGILLLTILADICRTWKREREAKRLAKLNDAALRCRHGVKRLAFCDPCAQDFLHINPCKTCGFHVDDRHPTHYCPASGHSGVSGFSGVSGLHGPPSNWRTIGHSGISGFSGFSGYGKPPE